MMGVVQESNTESGLSPRIGRSVTLDHAAQLLRVSRRTVYNRIRQGSLKTVRISNGSMRVTLESLGAVLNVPDLTYEAIRDPRAFQRRTA